ncbi:MAG TPA: 50S ribosomal protein L24 [Solirubrobacteraceae bacterium]|nr:50S ribosomal protein L24 [Solirubrobacteraceae bacterium]
MKIRSGDQVRVISGKDSGKSGRVLRTEPRKQRVYVEGMNMVKRHMRPKEVPEGSRGQTVGGVIEREGPIHVSNVMLLDPKGGRPTRVRIQREDGARSRVAVRSGAAID